jgi:hypothetical protein
VTLDAPVALEADTVAARTDLALSPLHLLSPIQVRTRALRLPRGARAEGVAVELRADFDPARPLPQVRQAE